LFLRKSDWIATMRHMPQSSKLASCLAFLELRKNDALGIEVNVAF
jgi:hypothetical protein